MSTNDETIEFLHEIACEACDREIDISAEIRYVKILRDFHLAEQARRQIMDALLAISEGSFYSDDVVAEMFRRYQTFAHRANAYM